MNDLEPRFFSSLYSCRRISTIKKLHDGMKQLPNEKKIDLLIFDLDGTLIDSRQDIANSVNYTLKKFNHPELSLAKVMAFVGDGTPKLIERSFPGTPPEKFKAALDIFKKYYREHIFDNTVLYPGVEETLAHFSLKKKVILSNKPVAFVQQIVSRLFQGKFDLVLGGDSLSVRKPSPKPIFKVLKEMNVPITQTVIVGDDSPDILSGKAAGITTCAVTYGFRTKEFLMQFEPDYCMDSFSQLKKIFI